MDPLSITASIAALITFSNGTFETLERLYKLRKSPAELAALLDEITDLKAALLHLSCIYTGRLRTQQQPVQLLERALQRTKDKLQELDALIQYDLTKVSKSGRLVPSKIKWLLKQDKITSLLHDLQPLRMSLLMAHGILHSSTSDRLLILFDSLVVSQDRALNTINSNLMQLTDRVRSIDNSIMPFIEERARASSGFATASQTLAHETYTANNMIEIRASAMPASYRCRSICDCACHTQRTTVFPEALRAVLGQLAIGYYGLRSLTPRCNSHSCRHRQSTAAVMLTYYFPTWFLQRAIFLAFRSRHLGHMEMSIHIPRVISSGAEIFHHVWKEDLEGIKQHFAQGLASPWDVNEFGWSALHYALAERDIATCEYLIMKGADLEAQTANTKETAIDMFHKLAVSGKYFSVEQENRLTVAMGTDLQIPFSQLTDIHQVILGRLNRPLEQELSRSPSDLNAIGWAHGTPLNWAAGIQNTEALRILLEHGADQTVGDNQEWLPLHHAAWQGNLDCVRLLVENANATSIHIDDSVADMHPEELEFSAAQKSKWDIVNARESTWARTPLMIALGQLHQPVVDYLLEHCVDINSSDTGVYGSVIFYAIRYQSLPAISKLLALGADYRVTISKTKESLLHLVAKWGNLEMMQFLTEQRLTNVDIASKDSSGRTPLECISLNRGRSKGNPLLTGTFQELLNSVRYVDDHQESGGDGLDVFFDCVEQL